MNRLKELLIQYGCPEDADVIEKVYDANGISFKYLRDTLISIGTIFEEIEEEKIYLATIKVSGNYATVAIQIKEGQINIISYAKEGIIKQNTAQKAIERIKDNLFDTTLQNTTKNKSPLRKVVLLIVCAIALILVSIWISVISARNAISEYNLASSEFNSLVDKYNSAVLKTSIDNIDGIPTSIEKINIEDDSFVEGFSVIFGKNSITKIKADTQTIYELVELIKGAFKIIEQITAPSGDWVEERIKTIEQITGTQQVTKDNNPDGLLDVEGGYSACVYFTVDNIDSETVKGDTIVAKGTDAGGAIEVYSSLEEAEARCEYLSGFDGTILYSGSYAIVGTTVIRTSYRLTNEEQFELTDKITQALTRK